MAMKGLTITKSAPLYLLVLISCYVSASNISPLSHDSSDIWLYQSTLSTTPDSTKVDLLYLLANTTKFKDPSKSLGYVNQAEAICKTLNDRKRKAKLFCVKGNTYQIISDYSNALFYYFQALRFYQSINDFYFMSQLLNDIGTCYSFLEQQEVAEQYFKESLQIRLDKGIFKLIGQSYNNLGLICIKQNRLEEALSYLKKAETANWKNIASLNINMGEVYAKLNNLNKAEFHYNKALFVLQKDSTNYYSRINCYIGLGQLYLKQKNYQRAETNLLLANDIAEKSGVTVGKESIYKSLISLYESRGNISQAYFYNKKLLVLNDSTFKQNTIKQMSEMQVKYETAKKDKEILSLNKDKEISSEKEKKEKILRNSFIVALCLMATILFMLARNIRNKKQMNELLQSKNKLIETQKIEIEVKNKKLNSFNKELIKDNIYARYEVLKSKVNPHFLFNSLSTLVGLIKQNPKLAIDYVLRFSQMYRAIITTTDMKLISLKKELELGKDFLYLQQIRFDKTLHVDFEIRQELDHLFLPPFALQMVLENVIKHNMISKNNPLNILIRIEHNFIVVSNPILKRNNVQESTGFGQKNLQERYELVSKLRPSFEEHNSVYIARLPLIHKKELLSHV